MRLFLLPPIFGKCQPNQYHSWHLVTGCPNARAGVKIAKKKETLGATQILTPVTTAGVALVVVPILVGKARGAIQDR